MNPEEPQQSRWLDDFANVRKIYRGLWIVCLLVLVGGEILLHQAHHAAEAHGAAHHGFGFERWPGFYGLFGFIACAGLVLAAKELRKLLMRSEDYYDA